jgi:alanine dehydrogenase
MTIPILWDTDVRRLADMRRAIARVSQLLAGQNVSPARYRTDFGKNTELVFAVGGTAEVGGARAYHSRSAAHHDDQAVIVWDMGTGAMKGAIFGFELGVLRMGAIGGVTINTLTPASSRSLALIGTGRQARSHLDAAMAVRDIREVSVFGRDEARRQAFTDAARRDYGVDVRAAATAEAAVDGAEIVVLATKSLRPLVKAEWLAECRLIHSVGYKSPAGKEMGLDVPQAATTIVTDSPSQLAEFGPKFILHGTDLIDKVTPLADYISGRHPRPERLVVSYPLGVAGSDVVVADDLISGHQS